MRRVADSLPVEGRFPPLDGATRWLNSSPLTPSGLRGKIVAVDFCTYTCINWLRTLPYIRAWSERYRDDGLVTIGVHTPEFSVEHDVDNIRRALREMRVEYPIAIDSDFGVWDAFANHYWPALYLIDAEGKIRYHHFGEGEYQRSEEVVQELLIDAGAEALDRAVTPVEGQGPEAAADWENLRSEETYVGSARTEGFASLEGIAPDQRREYSRPETLRFNEWALSGGWTVKEESTVSNEAGGRIAYAFHARDVHLVMGPGDAPSASFRVLLDGEPPGDAAGTDVAADGSGTMEFPRMYQLIRQRGGIGTRVFEIEFDRPGAQAFVFTFG
jgi:thiol-disulfide isomerase/thioredoxin